jgi:uncharacterized protein (TIGR02246 family)
MTLPAADSVAILQLVARADTFASARDADGYVQLFTAEARMEGAMGEAAGREQLRERVASVWQTEPPGTLHLTLNSVIEEDGTEIVVTSVMLMVQPGDPRSVPRAAHVRQTVVQTTDGWRIATRTISEHPLRP